VGQHERRHRERRRRGREQLAGCEHARERERPGEHRGEERAEDARAVAGDEPRGGGHGQHDRDRGERPEQPHADGPVDERRPQEQQQTGRAVEPEAPVEVPVARRPLARDVGPTPLVDAERDVQEREAQRDGQRHAARDQDTEAPRPARRPGARGGGHRDRDRGGGAYGDGHRRGRSPRIVSPR